MPRRCTGCLETTPDDGALRSASCGRKFPIAAGELVQLRAVPVLSPETPVVQPLRRARRENDSMPEPLADPLRGLRTGVFVLNIITFCFVVLGTLGSLAAGNVLEASTTGFGGLIGVLWIFGISRLLPNKPTDILYLRSFRTDPDTGGIRTSLERAFDTNFRISGIRDPRRRWPLFVRFFSYILFALKYANPRYLNLEAGNEWKGRLWRSLGESRGAVIDFTDLTPAVQAEIRLCVKCLGLERILFVVRDVGDLDEWRQRIRDSLDGSGAGVKIQIANWNPDGDHRVFEREVERFGAKLPDQPAGFNPDARPLAEHLPGHTFQESNSYLGIEIAIGLAVGFSATAALSILTQVKSLGGTTVAIPFYMIWYVLLWIHYVSFRRNSGSRRHRRIAFWTIFPVLIVLPITLIMVPLLLPSVDNVRAAAQRMQSANNLKQMALGMQNYESANDAFPPANAPFGYGEKKYPVSWRVLILPYIDEEFQFRQYRFDEPWDGPNNSMLLKQMPKTYLCPSNEAQTPPGYTYYRVFASKPNTQPSAVFVDGQRGPRYSQISDGTSNTILIVEAEEVVPWTMPEVLVYDRNQPMPKLGGHFSGGFNAALADGSVRFFYKKNEDELRAWITKDGGETNIDP